MEKIWSYQDDILIITSMKSANKLAEDLGRSSHSIRLRKTYLRNKTVDDLIDEQKYIISNLKYKSVSEMARFLGVSHTTLSRKIRTMKDEGILIDEDKPKINTPKDIKVEPMKKKIQVIAPRESWTRQKVQEDKLEVGKEYNIITFKNGDRRSSLSIKTKMTVIGCYPNHYLFVDEKGRKNSLSKVNLAIGEWSFEEIS